MRSGVGHVDQQPIAEVTRSGQCVVDSIEGYREHDRLGLLRSTRYREDPSAARWLRRRAVLIVRRIGHPIGDRMPGAGPALAERTADIASSDYRDPHIRLLYRCPKSMTNSEPRKFRHRNPGVGPVRVMRNISGVS